MSRIHLDPNANREALSRLSDINSQLIFMAGMKRSATLAEHLGGTGITGYKLHGHAFLFTATGNHVRAKVFSSLHSGNDESAWEPQEIVSTAVEGGVPLDQISQFPIDPNETLLKIEQMTAASRRRYFTPRAVVAVGLIIKDGKELAALARPLREALGAHSSGLLSKDWNQQLRRGWEDIQRELSAAASEMEMVEHA